MKEIKKLKLNLLSKVELEKREMSHLNGGFDDCTCGCHYEGTEGSLHDDNAAANWRSGYHSYGGGDPVTCSCYLNYGEDVHNDTVRPL